MAPMPHPRPLRGPCACPGRRRSGTTASMWCAPLSPKRCSIKPRRSRVRCCGLDVHKETVVACLRLVADGKVTTEVRTFQTTTADLLRLSKWLAENDCTHVAMEATGVYWKPVWHILDDGDFKLVLANAAHVKNVPGRKTDVNDAMWLAELL